jgi:hypothetical protein
MSIADELITRGWYQGDFENEDGSVCIAGAALHTQLSAQGVEERIDDFLNGPHYKMGVDLRMCRAIETAGGIPHGGIARWNDDPERTFDEVLRVAKEADEILDAQ